MCGGLVLGGLRMMFDDVRFKAGRGPGFRNADVAMQGAVLVRMV